MSKNDEPGGNTLPGVFSKEGNAMFKISLNRIHDTVRITEGNDTLTLTVNADPNRLVAGLKQAQVALSAITDDTTPEEIRKAAEYFADVIFGEEQRKQLFEFYRDDAGCVINICGKYFAEGLKKKIIRAQKSKKAEK